MYSVKIFVLLVKQMGMATYFKKKKKNPWQIGKAKDRARKTGEWRWNMRRVMNYIEAEEEILCFRRRVKW